MASVKGGGGGVTSRVTIGGETAYDWCRDSLWFVAGPSMLNIVKLFPSAQARWNELYVISRSLY